MRRRRTRRRMRAPAPRSARTSCARGLPAPRRARSHAPRNRAPRTRAARSPIPTHRRRHRARARLPCADCRAPRPHPARSSHGHPAMATIGLHASHEQFTPRELLDVVAAAEAAGFAAAMSSDHFMPWSEAQGQSGHAWSWLGAALERTSLPIGVVSVAGYRYHVAVVAQAAATLAQMYPGRFWLALGSGERLNEHITGERWPAAGQRDARLREC